MVQPDPSPLAEAATEFDEALEIYRRLGEQLLVTPLASVKQLERANGVLSELAGGEERLQAAGQKLVAALGACRDHQEALAKRVIAHVPAIQARNEQLHELMGELTAIAGEVSAVNTVIQGNGGTALSPANAPEISAQVLQLSARAEVLATTARAAEYEELAVQAHGLHERLSLIGTRLQKVSGD